MKTGFGPFFCFLPLPQITLFIFYRSQIMQIEQIF